MLIQALFSRGGDPIHMRVQRFDYLFEKNRHGDMVCEVISDEHSSMLISMGNFKEYIPPVEKVPGTPADEKKTKKVSK